MCRKLPIVTWGSCSSEKAKKRPAKVYFELPYFNPLGIFLIEFLNEEEIYHKVLITKIQGE
jgi:hypothetical protein